MVGSDVAWPGFEESWREGTGRVMRFVGANERHLFLPWRPRDTNGGKGGGGDLTADCDLREKPHLLIVGLIYFLRVCAQNIARLKVIQQA